MGEEAFEESEVAACDAFDRGDCLCVGEVISVESFAEAFPVAVEDKEEFVAAEGAVAVGEAEAAVELGVVAEALVDTGHTNEDDCDVGAVVVVTDQLKASGCQAFGLIDDDQLGPSHDVGG
ncbi:MAG: hypothetical protein K0S70_3637 [Microbacterium sp.]|nr:hypothetical protein [Microbacterium sp.]